jgi:1-hydroxy-2-isopentenylcarotenoid 3,4-desaturase
MSGDRRAVVIGGGIAGLASAALLAREGYAVTLLEARDELGGRAGSWTHEGFRFDTGPSWYLMPEVFDHFYRLLGTSADEQLDLVGLDPGYRVFFESHLEHFDVHADVERNLVAFEHVEPGAGAALDRYLASARDAYEVALDSFLYSTFTSTRPFRDRRVVGQAGRLLRLLLEPLDRRIRRHVTDLRLRQVLGYPAVFLGSSPFTVPSLYHLMSHLDLEDGVSYPLGGFAEVISTIERLARAEGVRMLTGCRAVAIETEGGAAGERARAVGVRYRDADGLEVREPADVVVAAADLHAIETGLLPSKLRSYPERWWRRRTPGPGAVLVMLGVRGALPQLSHHNLLFVDDWEGNFDGIFGDPGRVPDPASLYVCRPSATDASVAPPGHENLFVLVPVPADPTIGAGGVDRGGDARVEAIADAAIRQLAEWTGIADLDDRIVVRRTVGPADFEREFGSWRGSALGPAHTLRQSAFLRGRNASDKVDGLLYAGGSTIPGIGLPMCLISAELVIKRLRDDRTATPLVEAR